MNAAAQTPSWIPRSSGRFDLVFGLGVAASRARNMQETSRHTEHYTRAAVSIGRQPHCTSEFSFSAIHMRCRSCCEISCCEIHCVSDSESSAARISHPLAT